MAPYKKPTTQAGLHAARQVRRVEQRNHPSTVKVKYRVKWTSSGQARQLEFNERADAHKLKDQLKRTKDITAKVTKVTRR